MNTKIVAALFFLIIAAMIAAVMINGTKEGITGMVAAARDQQDPICEKECQTNADCNDDNSCTRDVCRSMGECSTRCDYEYVKGCLPFD